MKLTSCILAHLELAADPQGCHGDAHQVARSAKAKAFGVDDVFLRDTDKEEAAP